MRRLFAVGRPKIDPQTLSGTDHCLGTSFSDFAFWWEQTREKRAIDIRYQMFSSASVAYTGNSVLVGMPVKGIDA